MNPLSALALTGSVACAGLGYTHLRAYQTARRQMASRLSPGRAGQAPVRRLETWFAQTGPGQACADYLGRAGLAMSPLRYALILLGVGTALYLLGTRVLQIDWKGGASLVAIGIPVLTAWYLRYAHQRFLLALQDQVPELALLMANALRAGYGIAQAFDYVADAAQPPAHALLQRCRDGVRLGQPLEDALQSLIDRFDSPDLRLLLVTVLVHKETGGNLIDALEGVAQAIRQRKETLGEIRATMAQAKQTVGLLPFLPFLCGLLFNLVLPGFLAPLFTVPGLILLAVLVPLQVILALVIRRVTRIEV